MSRGITDDDNEITKIKSHVGLKLELFIDVKTAV